MSDNVFSGSDGQPGRIPRHSAGEFDFDGWRQLAVEDPSGYFEARRWVIDSFIAAEPEGAGVLRSLQNQIDATRASAGSPLKATWQLAGLMQDHVDLLGHQLDVLKRETDRLRARMPGGASSD